MKKIYLTWQEVERIPQALATVDIEKNEIRAFRSTTSGEVFIYDDGGRLLFHGGITSARAHEGENVGSLAALQWLQNKKSRINHTPTYGCPLGETRVEL